MWRGGGSQAPTARTGPAPARLAVRTPAQPTSFWLDFAKSLNAAQGAEESLEEQRPGAGGGEAGLLPLGCLTWSVTLPILSDAPPWRSSHRPRLSPPHTATRPGGRPVTAALQLRPQLFSRLLQPPTLKKAGVPPTHLKAPESPPPGSLPGSLLPPTGLHVLCSCAPRAPWLPLSRPPDWV